MTTGLNCWVGAEIADREYWLEALKDLRIVLGLGGWT